MELMVKLLGLFFIFLGCSMAGIEMELQLKRQWQFLLEMQEVLIFLEKEMTFHRTPLPEALRHGAAGRGNPVKGLLIGAAEAAEKRDGRTFVEIWKGILDSVIPRDFLTKEEMGLLEEVSHILCAPDIVMQKTLFGRCISRFEEAVCKASSNYLEKGRLYRRLSVTVGAFLVILLF